MMFKIAVIALALVAPALAQNNYEVSVLNETHLIVKAPYVNSSENVAEIQKLLKAAPAAQKPAPVVEATTVEKKSENDQENKEQPKLKLVADAQTNVTDNASANVTATANVTASANVTATASVQKASASASAQDKDSSASMATSSTALLLALLMVSLIA
jgi:type IV secretory pathway VirB10-like protein